MKKRGCFVRGLQAVLVLALLVLFVGWLWILLPLWGVPFNYARHTRVPLTPEWALECWLWEDDVNTADFVRELVAGYEQYDIPARTVLIDSPWSLRYNDFAVDEERYPDPAGFFTDLQNRGYRVVLWMTPLVNRESDDTRIAQSEDWYRAARDKGYLTDGGEAKRWWKGEGGFIDYTNPDAVEWWRSLQQPVLDWGIDGWKLDGAATLNLNTVRVAGRRLPLPWIRTESGWMTTRGYMDHYYRDEYRHGLEKNPEFITLARAIDGRWTHPEGFAPLDAAPVTWVGDQDHTWSLEDEGLEEALDYIMRSARLGYCIIGSDVAGYGGPEIPAELYMRWAQFSAFCGLFLHGGHGERRIWLQGPGETAEEAQQRLEVVRKFAWLHTELVPYIYSNMVDCHEGGEPLMRPTGERYAYFFGNDFFVSPIYEPSPDGKGTPWTVDLPEGRWRYLFDDREVIEGPTRIEKTFPLDEFPVYVRDGAIVPLRVSRPYTGFGDRDSEGLLTLVVYPRGSSALSMHVPNGSTPVGVVAEESSGETGKTVKIRFTGDCVPHILRVAADREPAEVRLDEIVLSKGNEWRYDGEHACVWIRTTECAGSIEYELRFPEGDRHPVENPRRGG
jgi:alpha-glucosidase (family GH31 glycosyl hydrolase)